ncbi:type VII secretion system-associated protein [Streptomyces sp. FXJ1.4098]|nr:type VII secretion system-associated protein [Streptomyces sp. FXJ1.4098]
MGPWQRAGGRSWARPIPPPTGPWAPTGTGSREYRPSPDAYGWARPVSPADAAVQLVATGYGSEDQFALALADAEVAVCLDEKGEPAVTEAPDGTSAVPVFSASPELEEDKLPPHEVMSVPDLLDRMPEGRRCCSSAPPRRWRSLSR